MAAEDLASALKNAIDRGESLERAASSLINAGYNSQDVSAAMQIVSQMASPPRKTEMGALPLQTTQPVQLVQRQQLQQNPAQLLKSSQKSSIFGGSGLVIASMIVVSLLILLLVGILFAILFG